MVFLAFIISARIKRAHNRGIANFVLLNRPIFYCVVDIIWRIAIVRCFLRFKLFQKLLIFFVIVRKFPALHAFSKFLFTVFVSNFRFVGILEIPIKIKRRQIQLWQLIFQQVEVPITLVAFVIYQPQGIHLLWCQIVHTDARYFFDSQLFCSQCAAMPNHNNVVFVHNNRLHKPILLDAFGNIFDLPCIVLFCVF